MLKVLCVLPVLERHKELLKTAAQGQCEFVFDKCPDDLADFDAVIGNIPADKVKSSKLKLLQLNSAGYEAYTAEGVSPQDMHLCNARGAYGLTVSEHMLALTMSLIRKLELYRDKQAKHDWSDCGNVTSIEGAIIAVLGTGDIGCDYARKVKALGAACVIGVRRSQGVKPECIDEQYTMEDLDKVLERADIIASVLPGGPATADLFNAKTFAAMKKGAYFINAGRGSSVDQEALSDALKSGQLAGAAVDVTTPEPLPQDSRLWDIPNLIITPHVAGNFFLQETFERIIKIAAHNISALVCGTEFKNEIRH